MGTGNYSATSNDMKLEHWPLIGSLLHLVQRGGDWASVPITVLPYDVPLLCGFNVPSIEPSISFGFPFAAMHLSPLPG